MTEAMASAASGSLPARSAAIAAGVVLACLLGTASIAVAEQDGHPLVSPFAGSSVEGQEVKEFDEQRLVIGKVQQDGTVKTKRLEGKVTRIDYRDPDNRSSLERIRNYELALKKAGFEIIYSCGKEECGPETQIETIGYYPPERYLAALLKKAEGTVTIGVFVAEGPWTKIKIVEEQPMETGLVKITADVLRDHVQRDGHVALYGILFDSGKSDLQPASSEAIKEIATLLRNNPSLQVYVVGHTDNVGKRTDNVELSGKRAAAVVAELTSRYTIEASRLEAGGVGPLAPVATNDTPEGKGLNRRVEIVKK